MERGSVEARPSLAAWLEEYAAIEEDFIAAHKAGGVTFAARGAHARDEALVERLRERGVRFKNGGASISTGFLSSACDVCVGGCGSRTFFFSLRCNRDCYFCFNPNQERFEEYCVHDAPWRSELEAFCTSGTPVTHIGLTGGEPLLCEEEALAFFGHARQLAPHAHLRLYTAGTGLDERCARALAIAGVDEVRISIKLEDGEASIEEALRAIACAKSCIPQVMVEMPVVPGTFDRMKALLHQLDELGVDGINLLEFCYPLYNWPEFERRGFAVKNPPFDVLYDYGYAGGLPIAGSENDCLRLIEFALDEGLSLGVHYCSLDNKNQDQILGQNRVVALDARFYEFDEHSKFYLTAKVFDGDVDVVRRALDARGLPWCRPRGEEGPCVQFHPRHLAQLADLPVIGTVSTNVIEQSGEDAVIREVKLEVFGG